MSRSARLIKGLGAHYAGQLLILVVGLWTTRYILGRLGKENYGLWLIGQQILTYVTLAEFGLIAIIPREIGRLRGEAGKDHRQDLQDYINNTAHLVLWMVPVVATAAAAGWFSLPEKWALLRGPLAMVMIGYTVLFPLRIFMASLQGAEDLAFASTLNTVKWVLSTTLSVGFLAAGFDLRSLAWGWLAGESLTTFACGLRVWFRFPYLLPRRLPRLQWALTRRQLVDGFWITLNTIAHVLFSATDLFLIGHIYGAEAVLPYAFTSRLIFALKDHAQAALIMSLPALSEVGGKKDPQEFARVCNQLILGQMLVSGAVACVLLAVNGAFVVFWLGDSSLYGGMALNVTLLAVMQMRHLGGSLFSCLFASGRVARIPLTQIADGVVTVTCSWLLLHWLGPIGAPLGSLVGVGLISVPLHLMGLADVLETTPWQLLRHLAGWLLRYLPNALGAVLLATVLPVTSLRTMDLGALIAGVSLVVACIYCLSMARLVRGTPLARFVPKPLARLLGG